MSWKDKLSKQSGFFKGFIIASGLFWIVGLLYLNNFRNTNLDITAPSLSPSTSATPITRKPDDKKIDLEMKHGQSFEELSPVKTETVLAYDQEYDTSFFDEYSAIAADNVVMIVRSENDRKKKIVYTGDEWHWEGDPHWLGNEHIFFTGHCGTSCQGLYLVNVNNKKTLLGVITYMFTEDGNQYTVFKDWFGAVFELPGFVKTMRAEMESNKPFLIFESEGENNEPLGEKRFLFTGNSLVLKK